MTNCPIQRPVDTDQATVPYATVFSGQDCLVIVLDLPGVRKEDVFISIDENNTLSVRAVGPCGQPGSTLVREFACGDYHREFSLGPGCDPEHSEAKLENGVLEITVPCNKGTRRPIPITS